MDEFIPFSITNQSEIATPRCNAYAGTIDRGYERVARARKIRMIPRRSGTRRTLRQLDVELEDGQKKTEALRRRTFRLCQCRW